MANKFVKQTNCSRFIRRIFKTDRQAQANGEEIVKQQLWEMEGRRLRKRETVQEQETDTEIEVEMETEEAAQTQCELDAPIQIHR